MELKTETGRNGRVYYWVAETPFAGKGSAKALVRFSAGETDASGHRDVQLRLKSAGYRPLAHRPSEHHPPAI